MTDTLTVNCPACALSDNNSSLLKTHHTLLGKGEGERMLSITLLLCIALLMIIVIAVVVFTESYLPGDNPSYDALVIPNSSTLQYHMMTAQTGNNDSRADNLAGTSAQEREFDNPLYASNSVAVERHYSIPGSPDHDHIYTIPSSPPRSNH